MDMQQLKIDPEFRDKIPPLTQAEFDQLKENILNDGEIYEPIVVWNGVIVDGHNRWKIIQEHPEIPYRVKEMDFSDKWSAFEWMYKKQLGRRNLTDEQRTMILGKLYQARKKSVGAPEGNQNAEKQCTQIGNIESAPSRVSEQIAQELGIGRNTVLRAARFAQGVDAIRKKSPEAAERIMAGTTVPKKDIAAFPQMKPDEQAECIKSIVAGEKPKPKKNEGYSAEIRKTRAMTRSIVQELYSDTTPEYTVDLLIESIQLDGENYTGLLSRTMMEREKLLTKENKPKVLKAIDEIIAKIKKIREAVKER